MDVSNSQLSEIFKMPPKKHHPKMIALIVVIVLCAAFLVYYLWFYNGSSTGNISLVSSQQNNHVPLLPISSHNPPANLTAQEIAIKQAQLKRPNPPAKHSSLENI